MFYLLIYPIWSSYYALKKPLKTELLHWLIWFMAYELITCVRMVAWWVPFFDLLSHLVLIGLYSPVFTSYFRKNVLFVSVKGAKYWMDELHKKIGIMRNMEYKEIYFELKTSVLGWFEYMSLVFQSIMMLMIEKNNK